MSKTIPQKTRDKISASLKNRTFSEEHRKNISIGLSKRVITDLHRKHMSESHKGKSSPRKGVHLSEETKRKLSVSHTIPDNKKKGIWKKCKGCGIVFYVTQSRNALGWGVFHSKKCQQQYQLQENSPQWRGGLTSLQKVIRMHSKSAEWKRKVFERDNYRDWFSGCKGDLEAHHIVPFSKLLKMHNIKSLEDALKCDALWDINNGITLLKSTHKAYHDLWGIGSE